MALLLIFMSAVISSYWYLTDPVRIRVMSRAYLSELFGGPVQINSASLTILEGLKLHGIEIHTDAGNEPDGVLLNAETIEIQYNPSSLLRGKLAATRIIVTDAHVHLVDDPLRGTWNFQRLKSHKSAGGPSRPSEKAPPPPPEVDLRNATLDYSEISGKTVTTRGSMAIDGRVYPTADQQRCLFEFQSRGALEGVGPAIGGEVRLKDGQVNATLSRFAFGKDIEAMLPRQVRDFWKAHKVEGALDIPEFSYTPATRTHPVAFRVRTDIRHVALMVRADELQGQPAPPPVFDFSSGDLPRLLVTARLRGEALLRRWRMLPEQPPMRLDDVNGTFVFDQSGVQLDHVAGSFMGARVSVNGQIRGYSASAPLKLTVDSDGAFTVPQGPAFLWALPQPARFGLRLFKPSGSGRFHIDIEHQNPTDMPVVSGTLDILDGNFQAAYFAYPVRHATGQVVFYPDAQSHEVVEMRNIIGQGIAGGPNAGTVMHLDGLITFLSGDCAVHVHVAAKNASTEMALLQAAPPPVRKALAMFAGPGTQPIPHANGSFDCVVNVPAGHHVRPQVTFDLELSNGQGHLVAFPYPLDNLHGSMHIGDGFLTLSRIEMEHNQAKMAVTGGVTWPVDLPDGAPVYARPDLHFTAHDMPIDETLLKSLPGDAGKWLRKMGVNGMADIDGPIVADPTPKDPGAINYHLDVTVHDGSANPVGQLFSLSHLGGKLRVHRDKVEIMSLQASRGQTDLDATGAVTITDDRPSLQLDLRARNLPLDEALKKLVPPQGLGAWDAINPTGTIDARLVFNGAMALPQSSIPATAPLAVSPRMVAADLPPGDFRLMLWPRDLSINVQALPYKLEKCSGAVSIDPQTVQVTDFAGQHGKARVTVGAHGMTRRPEDWDLTLNARDLPTDSDLMAALPPVMRQLLLDLKFKGDLGVELKSMRFRGAAGSKGVDSASPDIDFTGTLSVNHGQMDVGMPISDLTGHLDFTAAVRKGKLLAFHGSSLLDAMKFADHLIEHCKATMDLRPGSDLFELTNMQGRIAGGDIAGDVKLRLGAEHSANSYLMNFAIKNADVGQIAAQVVPDGKAGHGEQIHGQVSASLAMQGDWSDSRTRRGRGDVLVSGKEMYQIPLMLGLMEVTNLSLPTAEPFRQGTARYLVEGQRVTFEQVQMRSDNLVMSGSGWLDFDTKKVRMNFITENPNMPQLPLVHDLLAGAKQELFQIQVRGTVQHPKVSTGSLHTFTTTVDEVFNGQQREK